MDFILKELKRVSIEKDVKIYVVGGYVRNLILNTPSEDIDCVISERVEEVVNTFADRLSKKVISLGEEDKLYRIVDKNNNIQIDFTSMKGNSIEQDLFKRDFTLNSLAVDVYDLDNYKDKIIDPTNGLEDINNGIIRHVYDDAFIDDPIRMLRAVRFMSEFNFRLHDSTKRLINKHKSHIKKMPGERITQELFKILNNKNTSYYFHFMEKELDILQEVFPEIIEMRDVGECKYHVVDSLTHSLYTLEVIEDIIYADNYFEEHIRRAYENHVNEEISSNHSRLSLIKMGAFFHDIGKPSAKKVDKTGRVRFRGHEITGAEIVKSIAERLRLSIKERDLLYKYVSKHMYPLVIYKSNDVSGKTLYKMFSELKNDTLDILLISLADIIATRKLLDPKEDMGKYKVFTEYLANNYLTRFKDIEKISDVITGREILENFQLDEEVMIGDILEEVKKAIYNGKVSRRKKDVLKYIEDIL
ncbi:CCA tRNA nucleotidyltransferase [Caldisalinibacter kiritimatiensis]|uniref:tRNA nucleotidyltransferase, CC-adding n=1 Tax=Caldisalinibacter kiritimatiensis TaxID=1304284 RepID=R1AV69_9FIRM|nr:HDIG domain-containing metalloprotein [Caldisalinibacter kiritimatiensis]EOD01068.1 tRNA nucleotidyltransferase, CC-adding [Caldisalinibacter kiritimatiensis]